MDLVSKLLRKVAGLENPPILTRDARRRLRLEAERRIGEAARRLQMDDPEAAGGHLAWAQQAEEVLIASKRPLRKLYGAALVALACILLAGLALWLRTGNAPVILQVELHDLTLQLVDDRPWVTDDLEIAAQRIRLSNLQNLDASGLGLHGPVSSMAFNMDVSQRGEMLLLQELSASAGTRLLLHSTDYPRFDVKDGVLGGRIAANHVQLVLKGADGSKQYPIQGPVPETLTFTTRRSGVDPAQLMLESKAPWRIDGLAVKELVFRREEPPGSGRWVSTLLSGSIRLLETNKEITLHADDWLRLGRVEGHRLAIEFNPEKPDRFALLFHGTVETVETGPPGFIRNLAPTWLAYLYHQQSLALFWSAGVFLWGMLWSVRTLL